MLQFCPLYKETRTQHWLRGTKLVDKCCGSSKARGLRTVLKRQIKVEGGAKNKAKQTNKQTNKQKEADAEKARGRKSTKKMRGPNRKRVKEEAGKGREA